MFGIVKDVQYSREYSVMWRIFSNVEDTIRTVEGYLKHFDIDIDVIIQYANYHRKILVIAKETNGSLKRLTN